MTARTRSSLGRRLMATLIAASLGYWAVVVGIMIDDSINEAYELFDSHLAQTALALLRVADPDDTEPIQMPPHAEPPGMGEIVGDWPHLAQRIMAIRERLSAAEGPATADTSMHSLYGEYERHLRYQIWSRGGNLLLRSVNAPAAPLTERDGFSEFSDGKGSGWRMYGVWDQHGSVRVVVADAVDKRANLLRGIALNLVKPMVLGLPVLLFLLWYSIRRGLDPLRQLAREISDKRPESLTPIDAGTSPEEIRPMVLALNGLLQSVSRAMENERCFTANAAHELRTPLAAIQAHLAVARTATEPGEREQSLDQLQRGLERSIRLVGQLLTLARLDPEQALPDAEPVNIRDLLESACAEIAPLALARGQAMELTVAGDLAPLTGNGGMLAMLFANLIDNAIRYTPDGGRVAINAFQRESGLCVDVTDDGPGIPVAERERVFERFCRLADQSKPGTGLGLTICRRIAELHGAGIELVDGPGGRGLTVRLRFPAQAA
ncbi:MAG: sensor histidine kinase N-terminal domain-containing protein [Rhodocyclales bacterium]|nr:sensor histidine kinase N-terminal domain-containing protein [Rhodocyclales bacterium]